MAYIKKVLIPRKTVAGNIKDFNQLYEVFYYPKVNDLPDKIALYIYLSSHNKEYAKRSIYFSSYKQLEEFILDMITSYFRFRDIKIQPSIPLEQFRLISLQSFLDKADKRVRGIWNGRL